MSNFLAQRTFPFMLYWVCVPHFFKRQVFLWQTESKFMAILNKAVFRYPNSLALEKLELYLPQASSCFSWTGQYFIMIPFFFFFWLIRKQTFWLLSAKIINGLSCSNGKYDYDTENYVNGPAHTRVPVLWRRNQRHFIASIASLWNLSFQTNKKVEAWAAPQASFCWLEASCFVIDKKNWYRAPFLRKACKDVIFFYFPPNDMLWDPEKAVVSS